jgi:hypothetical protein
VRMIRRRLAQAIAVLSVAMLATIGSNFVASAHHGGAHRLHMIAVTCHTLTDPGDDEEPYLKLNGTRFWQDQDCRPGTRIDLTWLTRDFWADGDLELMEDDFGPDDKVLYTRVGPEANQGPQSLTRWVNTGSAIFAWYTLEWEVTG